MDRRKKWTSRDTCTIAKRIVTRLRASVLDRARINHLISEKETGGLKEIDATAAALREWHLDGASDAGRQHIEGADWNQIAAFLLEQCKPEPKLTA